MDKKIAESFCRTKGQREDSSQTRAKTEENTCQQPAFEFYNCDSKVRTSSKRKNTPQQMEKMVQQREQKSADKSFEKRKRSIKARELFELLENQEYTCALSGVELTPENVSCDHIVALEKGGRHDISNLQLVHRTVNRMKTTMFQDEFIKWCQLIAETNGS